MDLNDRYPMLQISASEIYRAVLSGGRETKKAGKIDTPTSSAEYGLVLVWKINGVISPRYCVGTYSIFSALCVQRCCCCC